MIYSGEEGHTLAMGGKLSLLGDKWALWRALRALWTNPPKISWQGAEPPPPFLAIPGFWEHLVLQPLPYWQGIYKSDDFQKDRSSLREGGRGQRLQHQAFLQSCGKTQPDFFQNNVHVHFVINIYHGFFAGCEWCLKITFSFAKLHLTTRWWEMAWKINCSQQNGDLPYLSSVKWTLPGAKQDSTNRVGHLVREPQCIQ